MPQIWLPTHVPFDIFSHKRVVNFQFPNFISKILLRLLRLICLDFFLLFFEQSFRPSDIKSTRKGGRGRRRSGVTSLGKVSQRS